MIGHRLCGAWVGRWEEAPAPSIPPPPVEVPTLHNTRKLGEGPNYSLFTLRKERGFLKVNRLYMQACHVHVFLEASMTVFITE